MSGPPSPNTDIEIFNGEVLPSQPMHVDTNPQFVTPPNMGPPDIEVGSDHIAFTPYNDPEAVKQAPRIGTGPDGRVALNLQAVGNSDRILANILFDKPEEKMKFFKDKLGKDWEIAAHPTEVDRFLVKKKGDRYWGTTDPGGGNLNEQAKDLVENIVPIAQALGMAEGPILGALTAGGIQAVRQLVKQEVQPGSSFGIGDIAIDAGAGALTGGSGAALNAAGRGLKKGAQLAAAEGKAVVARGAETSMWQRMKEAPKLFDSPEWIAREWGATADQFNDFQKKAITENIDFLNKASPEFVAARKAGSLKQQYQNMNKLLEDTGQVIGEAFKDPSRVVKLQDVFESQAYQDLSQAAETRIVKKGERKVRVNGATKAKIENARSSMLEQLGTMVLPEGPNSNNILNMFRKKGLGKSDLAEKFGTVGNNNATMMAILKDYEIPMSDAFMMRVGTDEAVKYGIKKGAIGSLSSARKMVPDAMRQAMEKSLRSELGDAAEQIIQQSEIYHNLIPLVSTVSKKVAANKAEQFNPLKTIPGWMLSTPRFVAALGRNLLQKPEFTALLRNGGLKIPIPEGSSFVAPKDAIGIVQRALKGGQFLSMDALAKKQLLSREANDYFDNPDLINSLGENAANPDYMDALTRQYERGDREGFSNTLSMLASDNEEHFNPAPYKSLVMNNGVPTITDMHDREQYRQFINKTVIDPKQRYQILSRLNLNNEMVKPPYEVPKNNRIPSRDTQTESSKSLINRVSDNLKRVTDVVELDDGNTRQDYDY